MKWFPDKYLVLKKNSFSFINYRIIPIRYEDRFAIMKWRNEQIYHLRQSKPLSIDDQEYYFNEIVSKLFDQEQPKQLLFSFLRNGECIGYGGLVHVNWLDRNAEISFIMDTRLEVSDFSTLWRIFLRLIEQVGFVEMKLHKLYTYAFDLRPHLYIALEAAGYEREATLKDHCYFEGKFIDVVFHSKTKSSE